MSERDTFNRHLLHPWADLPTLGEDDSTPVVVRGEGVYIYDEEGNRLLDGPGGMWCMQTGYGRREIADAVSEQIMQLGYSTGFFVINPQETELARRIAEKTPGDLNRVFFTTGGSTAVDSALRLCQLANNIKGQPHRKHILARKNGYHGSTFLAASVTGKERDKTAMDTLTEQVHFLSSPCAYYHDPQLSEQALCDLLLRELEDKIRELGPENIMCFIAEPVLASGGVIVPPADYNRRCWELVKEHGIVYIADEVVTAFGRLGHWFASEEVFGVVPDIITFAKGVTSGYLPLGGFAVSDRFMAAISGDQAGGNNYSNGYTWSASPVSCAAALASWDIIEREGLLDHVKETAPYFQRQMRTLSELPLVADIRGTGLMAAVEMRLENDAAGATLLAQDYSIGELVDYYCHQFGLLVRPLINVCVLSPPLIITREQIDDLVSALRKAIEMAQEELRVGG
jgi:adenosylmethionine-8-amino-7-oxononanoate aminotransferase